MVAHPGTGRFLARPMGPRGQEQCEKMCCKQSPDLYNIRKIGRYEAPADRTVRKDAVNNGINIQIPLSAFMGDITQTPIKAVPEAPNITRS